LFILIYRIFSIAFRAYYALIIIRVFLSWVPTLGNDAFRNFVYRLTEPVLGFFRRLVPMSFGLPIDFSPVLAIFALEIVQNIVLRILVWLM
jgi:YggT family protein